MAGAFFRDGFIGPIDLFTKSHCELLLKHHRQGIPPRPQVEWPKDLAVRDRLFYEVARRPALIALLRPILGEDKNGIACCHECKRPLTVIDYYREHLTGCMTFNLWGPPGKGRLRSKLLFLTSLHIEFVRGVGVTTAFSGCLIELDGFAGATLGTDNFIRVNKPS